ncbi:Predicted oxidoreductase [Sphingobium sp. AP50]|uniref:aldo/keto reductase n=1 Tax=Sphingobium sp. AP50 TaxID=1884369 RepID=UPI0008CB3FCB|nr:aldo/keto reductase [Sphingobium sp. AP50]SEJ95300.1 Predicted oxidoreductase [Sphingobium sp. AP50]
MALTDYVTLGRSGLRVSPTCLGTMTFGSETGWGMEEGEARAVFDLYCDEGGNFFDCANSYAGGTSERMLGAFVKARGVRDRAVIATKFTRCVEPGNPNAVGNGRKALMLSLDQSLQRLQTDYVDLYWMHSWDALTPAEEVMDALDGLVKAGKIRYYGLSDVPAWYAARLYTLAEQGGRNRPIALQMEYSLIERGIEREHLPAMQEMGMALCAWSPTSSGFLAGKYRRDAGGVLGEGRMTSNPMLQDRLSDPRNWKILDVVMAVARELGQSPVKVALNWASTQPGSTSPIIGARSVAQLGENLDAGGFAIPPELRRQLDDVSALAPIHPYLMFQSPITEFLAGGSMTRPWMPERLG